MAFPEDLKSLYVVAGATTDEIFLGTKAEIPTEEGPYVSIVETPSFGPEFVQETTLPCYVYPGAQVMVRASTRPIASARARLCWNASFVWNRSINGVWYRSLKATQEPWDYGLDDTGRIVYLFNVRAEKSPS